MQESDLLLIDEPVAGMTETETKKTSDLLLNIAKDRTIIIVEHDMNFIMNLCNPIIVLNEGKKIAEGNAKEIINNPTVLEAYLGRKTN